MPQNFTRFATEESEERPERHRQQPYYQRFPRDEWADTALLKVEEFGLLQRLRDYSAIHGPILDSEEVFKRLAATFQLSKYKFSKLWSVVENFFELRDEYFYYAADEKGRIRAVDISAKRRQAGMLGAKRRWSERNGVVELGMAPGMANAIPGSMANLPPQQPSPSPSPVQVSTTTTTETPPESGVVEVANSMENQGDGEKQNPIVARSVSLGMAVPGPGLLRNIRKKFPNGWTDQRIAENLVRLPGQDGPGLWGWTETSYEQLMAEAERQRPKPPRSAHDCNRCFDIGEIYALKSGELVEYSQIPTLDNGQWDDAWLDANTQRVACPACRASRKSAQKA